MLTELQKDTIRLNRYNFIRFVKHNFQQTWKILFENFKQNYELFLIKTNEIDLYSNEEMLSLFVHKETLESCKEMEGKTIKICEN